MSIFILILVWFVSAEIVSSDLLLPGPVETFGGLWKIVTSIDGWETILETCVKAFTGLFIALGMALV
ncbi:MAG TPA: ABC transporter permease, partial [Mesotoga infera]|nr:ABC transporter permease [Mesotoga infera]